MSSTSIITCNLNCICCNADCVYNHFISYKDRKTLKKFYDSLPNKNIEEPNNDTRKKNCNFGQLCENKNCGFRHRLNFSSREKLIVSYKFNKICPSPKEEIKTVAPAKIKEQSNNLFMVLDGNDDTTQEITQSINIPNSGKSWVSVVKAEKPLTTVYGNSDDENDDIQEDDGFYMKF
jgi:hypothetical protein